MDSLPPAWERCPRKGEIVQDKFLPFKTPLDSKFNKKLSPQDYFTPEMVVSSMKAIKVKIGLWIDLTNTGRYYNKEIVEKLGIKYFKLPTKGHKQPPTEEETRLFVNLCHNFILKNPLHIIAVHCTHGFNRTGFLISAYLIEQLDWAVDAALSTFSICRPHGIYKDDYIKELFRRYGDIEDAPLAPMRPAWREESEYNHQSNYQSNYRSNYQSNQGDNIDDDLNFDEFGRERPQASNSSSSTDNYTSSNGVQLRSSTEFMEGITGVQFLSDPVKSQELQRKVRNLCNFRLNGFPGAQPVSMSHENLNRLQREPYKVSWKADGTRYMMLIEAENEIYMFDRDFSVFKIIENCPKFPKDRHPDKHIYETLLDGEMVIDIVNGESYPRYLIYDIISFQKQDVGGNNFNVRTQCIEKEIIHAREEAKRDGRIDRSQELFGIRKKDFWEIEHTAKIFSPKFQKSMVHEVDGLIFQPVNEPYKAGQCQSILKWKPHTHNSIDFRVRIIKTKEPGCPLETWASLQVGRQNFQMGRIKATKEFRENDNKIVECTWDYANRTWKFMRVRTDKSYPNSYETANSVWETIKHPLTQDQLLSFIDQRGYRSQKRKYDHQV